MCGRCVAGILKMGSVDQTLPLPIFSSAHLSDSCLSATHLAPPLSPLDLLPILPAASLSSMACGTVWTGQNARIGGGV